MMAGILKVSFASVAVIGVCLGLSTQLLGQQYKDSEVWIKPPALLVGDTIAIVAPSSPVDVGQVQAYAQKLRDEGFRVLIPDNIGRKTSYLAGTDHERAEELNAMIRNPEVRAIFPARGGYGLTRILDRLDYDALRRDPKIITGYSDITALHLAVNRRCRLITFHSPVPMSDLWKGHLPEFAYAESGFRRAIFADRYPQIDSDGSSNFGFTISAPDDRPAQTLVGGIARGRLTGGNLTLISSTLGTPYAIDGDQAILFLEDVNEAPYRVDRMLSQLRLNGILGQVKGIILGDFSNSEAKAKVEMSRVLRDYFEDASVPVIWNFPVGHIAENATLPMGALVELDADLCTIRVLESPVHLSPLE